VYKGVYRSVYKRVHKHEKEDDLPSLGAMARQAKIRLRCALPLSHNASARRVGAAREAEAEAKAEPGMGIPRQPREPVNPLVFIDLNWFLLREPTDFIGRN
jgi:hypothetical protein